MSEKKAWAVFSKNGNCILTSITANKVFTKAIFLEGRGKKCNIPEIEFQEYEKLGYTVKELTVSWEG